MGNEALQRLQAVIAPLHSRDFTLLWLSQAISLTGTNAAWIAWLWLLTDLTGSSALIGTVLMAYSVPTILLLVVAGAWVDQGDPRRIALWAQTLNAVLGFGLAVLVTLGQLTATGFIVFAILFGAIEAFINPALAALFPALIRPREFNAANSLRQMAFQSAALLGPSLGALLISRWSITVALAFNAVTFVIAAVIITFMHRPTPPVREASRGSNSANDSTRRRRQANEVLGGFRFLRSEPGMLSIVVLFSLTNALNNVEAVLVPELVRSELGLPVSRYGFMVTFFGVGCVAGAIGASIFGEQIRRRALSICGMMSVFGASIATMGLARNASELYGAYLLLGLSFVVAEIVSVSLWQQLVPSEMRGRVFGLLGTIAMVANPVGYLFAGVIGEVAGVRLGLQVGGGAIIILSLLALLVPAVWQLDHRAYSVASAQCPYSPTDGGA